MRCGTPITEYLFAPTLAVRAQGLMGVKYGVRRLYKYCADNDCIAQTPLLHWIFLKQGVFQIHEQHVKIVQIHFEDATMDFRNSHDWPYYPSNEIVNEVRE